MKRVTGSGAGGEMSLRICRGESLAVGPVTWTEPIFGVTDLSALERAFGVELAGVFGAEILEQAQWIHDRAGGRLDVLPPNAQVPASDIQWLPIVLSGGHVLLEATFEGHSGYFVVDSGGGGPGVNFYAPAVEEFGLLEGRKTRSSRVAGFGGSAARRAGSIDSFAFGDLSWSGVPASFAEGSGSRGADPHVAGLIGFAMLDPHVVVYDYPGRRLGLFER